MGHETTLSIDANLDKITDLIEEIEGTINEFTEEWGELDKGIQRIRWITREQKDALIDSFNKDATMLTDFVLDNDGLIMRLARIHLLSTASDMEKVEYGHSWIYKMERGTRDICPLYVQRLAKDLEKTLLARYDKGEEE